GEIIAALGLGGLAARERPELDARRQPERIGGNDQVEMERFDAALVLRRIDAAHTRLNANGLQVLDVSCEDALRGRVVDEELELKHLAAGVDALAVFDLPTRLAQQPPCL